MGNITNPNTGTKIDGSTWTAAECNGTGSSFTRCLVNDGQSDLVANASIAGGANKSFAFTALTAFGVSCSGALSQTCGSYALNCAGARTETCASYGLTCSGAVVIGAASYTVTTSGAASLAASGPATLSAGGANNLTLSAGGSILATASDDVTVTSGNNIVLSATDNVITDAGKLSLTGSDWPGIGSRPFASYVPPSSVTLVSGFAGQVGTPGMIAQTATGGVVDFLLWVPPGTTVAGASVRLLAAGSPGSLPGTKPKISLYSVDALTTAATLHGSAFDPSSTVGGYTAVHQMSIAITPVVASATQRFFVRIDGAVDADPNKWVLVAVAPTLSVTFTKIRLA